MGYDRDKLEAFLLSVERRAFFMARQAVGNDEDAFDHVQEAMTRFVKSYAGKKPENEWKPLFYRVLQNSIADWRRREAVRSRFRGFLGRKSDDAEREAADPFQNAPDPAGRTAEKDARDVQFMNALRAALGELTHRQRQVFLLRALEGLSTIETAKAMNCSEGSVKTHYSRAREALREKLGEHWP